MTADNWDAGSRACLRSGVRCSLRCRLAGAVAVVQGALLALACTVSVEVVVVIAVVVVTDPTVDVVEVILE